MGFPESSDVRELEIPKFISSKRRFDLDCDRGGGVYPKPITYCCLGKKGVMAENRDDANDIKIKGLVSNRIVTDQQLILRNKITGACLNVRGTILKITVFLAT